MQHVDPDILALVALGEPVASDAEQRHVGECSVCAAALSQLRATAAVGRASRDEGSLLAPPDRVWDAIAAELDLSPETRPAGKPATAAPAAPEAATAARPQTVRAPASLAGRRERRRRLLAGGLLTAAAAAVVLALGITALQSAFRPVEPTVLAEATLESFPDWPEAEGAAVLEQLPDGTRQVEVRLDAAVGDDAFREVWLIRGDASDLVSLGVLQGTEGTFVVPEDVDVGEFNLVDVSQEPRDGDPAHSGDSIVRGPLT